MSFDKEVLKNEEFITTTSQSLFETADTDKSGFIDRAEFKNLLVQFSRDASIPLPSDEEIEEIVSTFDTNNDQKFSLNEFTEFIRKVFEVVYNSI